MSTPGEPLTELSFTLARGQNQFFVELAEAFVYELRALGLPANITVGEIPVPREGLVHVFVPPHEYVSHSRYRPPSELLRRSIVISAEQPETHFFAANVPLARDAGAVFDINPRAVRAYRSEGIAASLLKLGHTSLWDRFEGSTPMGDSPVTLNEDHERDIDILFLGRLTQRRAAALASYAGTLERFRCHIGLADQERAHVATGATFLAGERKRDLLARSKVLLNVHGEELPYFEWLRATEAICAGCAVVSEHSSDIEPLQSGKHILTGQIGSLGLLCSWLADDVSLRERMRAEAYELLRQERPLSDAADELAAAARKVDAAPIGRQLSLAIRQERARGEFRESPPVFEHQPSERPELSDGETIMLRALKEQTLAIAGLKRQLAHVEFVMSGDSHDEPRTRLVLESPAWTRGAARSVTAVVPLYNHRRYVLDALHSLERSIRTDWEVVIVDDASTDAGGDAVRAWIDARPHLACRLVRHDLNRGLAAARNTGVEQARADRVLMLDADNELRRTAIGRLMAALDSDPLASFAYGIVDRFSVNGVEGLLNCYAWDPERLRGGNFIDAFALIRREAVLALEGYSCDSRLYGWEDYDLWVRMAEAGKRGVFAPEIIGRYRVRHSSMIAGTNVSTADAYAALIEHAPRVLAGLRVPR